MNYIIPIELKQQQQVISQVKYFIDRGMQYFERSFAEIPVLFNLKGKTSGMYRVSKTLREIRFNPWIFSKYFDESLTVTVPHEVAHYLTDEVFGLRRIRPHGQEWKQLMEVFGADSRVRSQYSLDGIPMRQVQQFLYRCECQKHQLSSHRHNRIRLKKVSYHCRNCGTNLYHVP